MKKTFFIRAVCFAAALVLCFSTALSAGDSDNLIKLLYDTTVFLDPGLKESCGILSAGSVVYAGESVFSEEAAALEITFSHDHIIHTGYISLMSGIGTLTDAESKEYAEKAPEGILFMPGIILLDVSFTADDSFDVAEALPPEVSPVEAPEGSESEPAPVVSPEAEPVPELPAEAADPAGILPDDASQDFAVQPEGPFAGGAEIPGFVKILDAAAVCVDPALQRPMDELPAGAIVYADSSDPASGTVVVIFCVDYIIRTGFVSEAAVGPLTETETAEYEEKARDGIVYRPGIILLNTVSLNSTAPEQPDPSEIAALPTPEAFAPAIAEPTAAPKPTANVSAADAGYDTSLFPPDPEKGNYPLPLDKRYVLNSEEAIRRGTTVNSVVLPVSAPGRAEGIIDFGVVNQQGVLVIVESYAFSEDISGSTDRLVVPVNFSYKTGDTYALVRFLATNTCTFSMKADKKAELVYFDDKNGVFLVSAHIVPGYCIDYHFR